MLLLPGGSELPENNSEIFLLSKFEKSRSNSYERSSFKITNSGLLTGTGPIFSLNESGNLE